jgi:hypothetical protein
VFPGWSAETEVISYEVIVIDGTPAHCIGALTKGLRVALVTWLQFRFPIAEITAVEEASKEKSW